MAPEEEQEYIESITSQQHTRIADAEHERQQRQHAELNRWGVIPRGLTTNTHESQ